MIKAAKELLKSQNIEMEWEVIENDDTNSQLNKILTTKKR